MIAISQSIVRCVKVFISWKSTHTPHTITTVARSRYTRGHWTTHNAPTRRAIKMQGDRNIYVYSTYKTATNRLALPMLYMLCRSLSLSLSLVHILCMYFYYNFVFAFINVIVFTFTMPYKSRIFPRALSYPNRKYIPIEHYSLCIPHLYPTFSCRRLVTNDDESYVHHHHHHHHYMEEYVCMYGGFTDWPIITGGRTKNMWSTRWRVAGTHTFAPHLYVLLPPRTTHIWTRIQKQVYAQTLTQIYAQAFTWKVSLKNQTSW